MRRLLVAGFAALAVLLGLVATTGVASAAAPVLSNRGDVTCTAGAAASGATAATSTSCTQNGAAYTGTPCAFIALATTCTTDVDRGGRGRGFGGGFNGNVGGNAVCPGGNHDATGHCLPIPGSGFPRGGYGGGWHPGLPWGGSPTLYGHQLWLNANLGLDICGYGNSYDTFLGRNLVHRSDIDRYLGRSRWQSLYSSDCNSNLAVIPGGLTLVNGNLLNLSLLGLNGAGTVNVCDYPDYNVFSSRFGSRFGGRFDSVRNHFGGNAFGVYRQLRVNARCTTVMIPSSTTIVQDPNTTYSASAPTTDPSSGDAGVSDAPASSTPLPAIAPAKAPSTGGWDTASVLAHARVV